MKSYQVQDADLNDEQRAHLYGRLFPLMSELKRKARERLASKGAA